MQKTIKHFGNKFGPKELIESRFFLFNTLIKVQTQFKIYTLETYKS